ncbi:hypothetical protein Q3O59_11925 [Alkalimonas delamerensis]|uniref:Tissue inhibitor of metalloproteinase n=1 Tax=Alkalimonas delamerensis TaxID=265981 RepID=A0ABT9GRX2_9GAMM|nr:hypothetical protein [Alkalimonas delamerensis]MDP4529730.1 hypothetical protein [Alkalimonas delamerensis]
MRFFLAIIVLLISGTSFAFSCSNNITKRDFEKADYVYIGRVMSAAVTPDEVVESQLQVKEVLKGKPDKYVFFSAASFNAMCEGAVLVGADYIVFGRYGEKTWLTACGSTQEFWHREQIDMFISGS